jgi:hypothetical protein
MLPPQLAKIKVRLEAKRSSELKREEAELLEELRSADQTLTERQLTAVRESVIKITSGPSGVCACCGR